MKIRTKIPVKHNVGTATQEEDIVIGDLNLCIQDLKNGPFTFNYKYYTINNIDITTNSFSLTKDEVNGMYQMIGGLIPTGLDYTDSVMYLYYIGMMYKMAETFKVTPNDVEIF